MIKIPIREIVKQNYNVKLTKDEEIKKDYVIQQLDSLLFDQLRQIRGKDSPRINELILVIAKKTKKKEDLTKKLLYEGFNYNNVHYVRFGKSSAEGKAGITVFVDDRIFTELTNRTQLDIPIDSCVVSKYENQRCLPFSTCTLVDGELPYIVIVNEYTKVLPQQMIRYVVEKKKEFIDKQTGEIKPYNSREIEEGLHDIQLSPFDGSGCHTHEISKRISDAVGLDYIAIGAQIRLPFFKGYSVEVPFKAIYKDMGITKIKDVFGTWHNVDDIDCIWNTSMFKGYKIFKKQYGSDGWNKYLKVVNKYHYKLGISKYSHHVKNLNLKSRMNFQYLQCLDLWNQKYIDWFENRDKDKPYYDILDANNEGKIIELAKYSTDMYNKIIKGDKFYTYKFLGIDDTDEYDSNGKYGEAILINDTMLKDPAIKQFMYRKLKKRINQMKFGKVYASGLYNTCVGDMIGYLQYAAGKEPTGCLKSEEFYCKTVPQGNILSFRSPLVCPSEVNDVKNVDNEITKKWFNHFDDQDVVMLNMYDLSMPRQGGMDTDGDAIYLNFDSVLYSSKIHKTMIIDVDDKVTVNEKPYNQESIVEYEMNSRDNRIGEITNVATSILNRYTTNDKYLKQYADDVSLLRIYQGKEIDFLKTGLRWQMNNHLRKYAQQIPYFLLFRYPKKLKQYYSIKNHNKNVVDNKDKIPLNAYHSPSPMNELSDYICSWEKKKIQWDRSVVNTSCLVIDNSLQLNDKSVLKRIKHIITDFTQDWSNACRNCEDTDDTSNLDVLINSYKKQLSKIVPDPILIANYVIKASYSNISTNKTLAWSGYGDVIIDNLKKNTPKSKNTQIFEVPDYIDNAREYLGKYYLMMEDGKVV